MDQTTELTGLSSFLARNSIPVKRASEESGVHFTSLHRILKGHQIPTVPTVQSLLDFARRYEPGVTFEDLFADPGANEAPETPERAVAAAGGDHG